MVLQFGSNRSVFILSVVNVQMQHYLVIESPKLKKSQCIILVKNASDIFLISMDVVCLREN